ncbi:MAG: DNA-3-methyladenine glycosylase 2 [Leptospiraceae bacterium]|nr:DNA-3-methyladenine glycosylase 2 [Leptospiraceae bacterium]
MLNADTCYRAVVSRDARFDGAFFIAVSSTRIYCRTVCRVKTPLRKNCTFYPTAAAAEAAGYRPCLRCRPELAPGNSSMDAVSRLARLAMQRIEAGALSDASIAELADEFGVTDRHLRRVLVHELGVSPVEIAQTRRLHLAKQLLTDTTMPVTDIAYASGFASVRRFNALFKERYRLKPGALRQKKHIAHGADLLRCPLSYRPPLDWPSLLAFLAARAVQGVEMVHGDTYARTVAIDNHRGVVTVANAPEKNQLIVSLSPSLLPALVPVLFSLRRLFDLDADPAVIAAHLGKLAAARPGLRVPGAFDGFEIAVRAILGQQISVKAATTLSGRIAAAFGENIDTDFLGLTHIHPTAEKIAHAGVGAMAHLGVIRARAQAIHALAEAVHTGTLSLAPSVDVAAHMERLKQLPGIGEWTAQYIAMRTLAWPDAFPHTDLAVMKALRTRDTGKVLGLAEAWRPWRSYAAMHLWMGADTAAGLHRKRSRHETASLRADSKKIRVHRSKT